MLNFVHRCLWAFYPGEMARTFHWIPEGVHAPKKVTEWQHRAGLLNPQHPKVGATISPRFRMWIKGRRGFSVEAGFLLTFTHQA